MSSLDKVNLGKGKIAGAKSGVSRAVNAMDKLCIELSGILEKKADPDFQERTALRIAEEINSKKVLIREKLDHMEATGVLLIEAISSVEDAATAKQADETIKKIEEDMDDYFTKYENLRKKHANTLEEVYKLSSPKKPPSKRSSQQLSETDNPNSYDRFTPQSDLKPTFLDQDSTMIEINHWCSQLTNYLKMGYRGNLPKKGISLHLAPLMHASWIQALDAKKLEELPLEEITEIIKEEGKLRMPVHQRRLQLLKARRNQTRHTEFIFQLEKLMSVAEFTTMTQDEMLIHIFAETADPTMSRIALEVLASEKTSTDELRTRVTETESALWYKGTQKLGKIAKQIQGERKYCETCKGKSHNTKDCWGKCEICKKFGHKTEICRYNPVNLSSENQQDRANRAGKKKKDKKTGIPAMEKTQIEEDNQSYTSKRAKRVGATNIAKRATFKYPGLNAILSNMKQEDQKEWGEGVCKALRAKSARSQDNPTVHGTVWSKRNGGISTEVASIMD